MHKTNSIADKNPFFSAGVGFSGLIHNLKGHPPEWMQGMIRRAESCSNDPIRLAAIAHQAKQVKNHAIWAIESISEVLALALDTEECTNRQAQKAAYAINFLTEIAQVMDAHENTAEYMIANPGLLP